MIRALHRWPGLLAAVVLLVLGLSGAALSVFPAAERLSAPQAEAGQSVADLVGKIAGAYPTVEQIRRAPSGKITAYWFEGGTPMAAVIDPATGQGVASADPNAVERWLTNLHRSFFLDDAGRLVMASGAGAMLILSLSGAWLIARRAGGWRRWCAPMRGAGPARWHAEMARVASVGLLLSAGTALWMTASTFDLLPDGEAQPGFPASVSGAHGVALADLDLIGSLAVTDLRSFTYPYPGDASDVFTLKTDAGSGYIDQGTGALLAWADATPWQRVSETIYMLHTGQGASVLGLALGLIALAIPGLAGTGLAVWLSGRGARGFRSAPAAQAETIVLVGSEGGSTRGFAETLARALGAAGQPVHVAPMSAFAPKSYGRAKRILILAATYGDGVAPASAKAFLDRLAALPAAPKAPLAVLGFGDRSFPAYCAYAAEVATAAEAKGWQELLPLATVDRQSPQDFHRWGVALGQILGVDLVLSHAPRSPRTTPLELIERRDYGAEVQAPTAILRFALPRASLWQRLRGRGFGRFVAGDLIGVVPEGASVPRFYSLASATRDGFVEIVVRKQPGGLCSGQLMALQPGDRVRAFLRRNPGFHAGRDRAPLILIGAGTGIGPLAGFVRANARRRPMHLFFGMRHAASDFLYGEDLAHWQAEGRLTRLITAASRGARPHYVQDALRADAAELTRLIQAGARIMVCGGREMAAGVSAALGEILAPAGLSPVLLKAEGRYVEDIY
ncbi:PepSY domain-containing protein [Sedimentimonas flavescens]|uniref:NADPH--hemoprotein reductase n=1 Tax=Sedimentimonas flavescens TaxID=2851012 RepID=A0ABT3A245_9RHOB|nr:PepSY domain-containing protein [Sedimentimonas flavescens]MCV2880068.1 PepSY domain-containing protein [Sedimentimonas flavescens]